VLLPGAKGTAEVRERGGEERFDVVRLEPGGFSPVHLTANLIDLATREHRGD